ncbi:MAG TPA: SRPBCC family protein [Marmoricola sp.]|jgi:hypothetical protein|nr:SRPBCC family protein [Marmoricola sp.]
MQLQLRAPSYRFTHDCVVPAPRPEVRERLLDLEHYPDWWPQVRAVARIDDDNALVVCRSTLPYDLELHLTALRRDEDLLAVGIDGPIRGEARWRLHDEGPDRTRLAYEQEVRVEAPLLRVASLLARPLLEWNHARMMRGAEQGLAGAATHA